MEIAEESDRRISEDPHLIDLVDAYEEAKAKLHKIEILRKEVYHCRRALVDYIGLSVCNIR